MHSLGKPRLILQSVHVGTVVVNAPKSGCRYVASGPLVRSSYKAGEFFIEAMIDKDRRPARA